MTASAPLDARAFREAMSSYCSGLTIIAACPDGGEPVGMTCQSFHSLSLDPPLVAFFVASGSTTFPRLRAAGSFCINILSQDQRELALQFSKSGADRFHDVGWRPDMAGHPMLDGALTALSCRLHSVFPGGDHQIVVAGVDGISRREEGVPLLFYRSGFHTIASPSRPPAGPAPTGRKADP